MTAPTPLRLNKDFGAPSLFQPQTLLREARRQKQLSNVAVPEVCLLDPDGDVIRCLAANGQGRRHRGWACYYTDMWVTDLHGIQVGVVGLAVGLLWLSSLPNSYPPAAHN